MHRFFLPPENFHADPVRFTPEQAHQIRRVLRLQSEAQVMVLDGLGQQAIVRLQIEPEVVGEVVQRSPAAGEPRVQVQLCFSLTQREKLEWILQKGTEVGVSGFQPFISSRSLAHQAEAGKLERWGKIVREAAEQSGRGSIPILHAPQLFTQLISNPVGANHLRLAAWEQERSLSLAQALHGQRPDAVEIWIGPEGGFSEEEMSLAGRHGAQVISLGTRILRMETAAMLAPALVLYELEGRALQG